MRYVGCVTDHSFKLAIMELHPNRRSGHPDEHKRKKLIQEKRDLPYFANEMQLRESIAHHYYPSVDFKQKRWAKARSYHLFDYDSIKDKNVRPAGELIDLLNSRGLLK